MTRTDQERAFLLSECQRCKISGKLLVADRVIHAGKLLLGKLICHVGNLVRK